MIIIYFLYHALTGERGILATLDINEKITEKKLELEVLQTERALIERKIQQLVSGSIEYDFIDELARQKLGFAADNEKVIVIFPNSQ